VAEPLHSVCGGITSAARARAAWGASAKAAQGIMTDGRFRRPRGRRPTPLNKLFATETANATTPIIRDDGVLFPICNPHHLNITFNRTSRSAEAR
jgi:hypothetical protein